MLPQVSLLARRAIVFQSGRAWFSQKVKKRRHNAARPARRQSGSLPDSLGQIRVERDHAAVSPFHQQNQAKRDDHGSGS